MNSLTRAYLEPLGSLKLVFGDGILTVGQATPSLAVRRSEKGGNGDLSDSSKPDKRNYSLRETRQRQGLPSQTGALPRKPSRCERKGGHIDRLLRIADVQEMTGLSRASVYRMVEAGLLPPQVRFSARCVRWKESELLAYMECLPRSSEPV